MKESRHQPLIRPSLREFFVDPGAARRGLRTRMDEQSPDKPSPPPAAAARFFAVDAAGAPLRRQRVCKLSCCAAAKGGRFTTDVPDSLIIKSALSTTRLTICRPTASSY